MLQIASDFHDGLGEQKHCSRKPPITGEAIKTDLITGLHGPSGIAINPKPCLQKATKEGLA